MKVVDIQSRTSRQEPWWYSRGGVPNGVKYNAQQKARTLIEDTEYWDMLVTRAKAGILAPAIDNENAVAPGECRCKVGRNDRARVFPSRSRREGGA